MFWSFRRRDLFSQFIVYLRTKKEEELYYQDGNDYKSYLQYL